MYPDPACILAGAEFSKDFEKDPGSGFFDRDPTQGPT